MQRARKTIKALFGTRFALLLAVAMTAFATLAPAETLQPGDILVADQRAAAVLLIREPAGGTTVTTLADSAIFVDGLPIFSSGGSPNGIALEANGNIIVDDAVNSRVLRIDPVANSVIIVAQGDTDPPPAFGGSGSGVLFRPRDFAVESSGNILVVQDRPPAIFRITPDGSSVTTVAAGLPFVSLGGIALEADGNILVTDLVSDGVFRVDPAGTSVTTVVPSRVQFGIEVEPDGEILVTVGGSSVNRIDPDTGRGSSVANVGLFFTNSDLALEASGNILVASLPGPNGAVFRIDPTLSPFPPDPTGRSANVTAVLEGAPLAGPHGIVVVTEPAVVELALDIKPGSFPNSINPRSKGKIPVAILTTQVFDAASVDETTIRFGRTGAEAAPVHFALGDVDGDLDVDMVLHVHTRHTGLVCGDTAAFLTGETLGGRVIVGSDSIRTVGCK